MDQAAVALAEYDAQMQKKTNPPKGVVRWVVPVGTDGRPIDFGGLERERLFAENGTRMGANEFEDELLSEGLIEKRPKGGYDPREYGDGLIDSAETD